MRMFGLSIEATGGLVLLGYVACSLLSEYVVRGYQAVRPHRVRPVVATPYRATATWFAEARKPLRRYAPVIHRAPLTWAQARAAWAWPRADRTLAQLDAAGVLRVIARYPQASVRLVLDGTGGIRWAVTTS